jgi:hypothetical protein
MKWRLTELPFLGVCLPRQSVYVSVSVGGCLCYRHTCWWWCCGLSAAQRKRERGYLPLFADDDREHSLQSSKFAESADMRLSACTIVAGTPSIEMYALSGALSVGVYCSCRY